MSENIIVNDSIQWEIFRRSTFTDPWVSLDELGGGFAKSGVEPVEINYEIAPGVNNATLKLEYGYFADIDQAVPAFDLRGDLIKITFSRGTVFDWYGICIDQKDVPQGKTTATASPVPANTETGLIIFNCLGFEHFLQNMKITESAMEAKTGFATGLVNNSFNFNAFSQSGFNRIVGNRSKDPTNNIFKFTDNKDDAKLWGALDAVKYLLDTQKLIADEVFDDFNKFEIFPSSTAVSDALNAFSDVWDMRGKTFFQALNTIIQPARGFAWWVDATSEFPQIVFDSITDTPILDGNTTVVPANVNTFTLTPDDSNQFTVEQNTLEESHYDAIEVRGEDVRAIFTMSYPYTSMADGWTPTQQSLLNTATKEDQEKNANSNVYSHFVLPDDWDGNANSQIVLAKFEKLSGDIDPDNPTIVPNFDRSRLVLDRSIPLLDEQGNERPPLVICQDTVKNKYFRVDRPITDTGIPVATISTMDDDIGIRLRTRHPIVFGLPDYIGNLNALQFQPYLFAHEEIIATVSMFYDEKVRVFDLTESGENLEMKNGPYTKVKYIDIPDVHYWYMVKDTVTDFSGTTLTKSSGEIVRDDTATIKRILEIAKVWYGKERVKVRVDYQDAVIIDRLGQLATEVFADGAEVTANTIVTSIGYRFAEDQSSFFKTEFFDLDFRGFQRLRTGTTRGQGVSRPSIRGSGFDGETQSFPTNPSVPTGEGYSPHSFRATIDPTAKARLIVGDLRPDGWNDFIQPNQQAVQQVGGGAKETIVLAATGYVWYEVTRGSVPTVSALKTGAGFPQGTSKIQIFLLGWAEFDVPNARIKKWFPFHSGNFINDDDTFRVSSNDTDAKWAVDKLIGSSNIIITETDDGGDETLVWTLNTSSNDVCKVKVSSDDTTCDFLSLKLSTSGVSLGDDPGAKSDNASLVRYTINGGANEVLTLDIDINRLANGAPSGTSVVQFSTGVNNGTHNKETFDDLSNDGITFSGGFNVDPKRSVVIDAGQVQLSGDEDLASLADGDIYGRIGGALGYDDIEVYLEEVDVHVPANDQFLWHSGGNDPVWELGTDLAEEGVQYTDSGSAFKLDFNGLTEETGLDTDVDWIPFYDVSAGVHRKIKFDDMLRALTGRLAGTEQGIEETSGNVIQWAGTTDCT